MDQIENTNLGHLLMHVCRMRGKTADQFMGQCILYHGQGRMLKFISMHEGLTHSEISEKLRISPAATTKVIKRLEKVGYLERRSDEHDERISRVFMKDEGKEIIEGIDTSFQRLDEKTFNGFSEKDLDQLRDFLNRILNNLRKH